MDHRSRFRQRRPRREHSEHLPPEPFNAYLPSPRVCEPKQVKSETKTSAKCCHHLPYGNRRLSCHQRGWLTLDDTASFNGNKHNPSFAKTKKLVSQLCGPPEAGSETRVHLCALGLRGDSRDYGRIGKGQKTVQGAKSLPWAMAARSCQGLQWGAADPHLRASHTPASLGRGKFRSMVHGSLCPCCPLHFGSLEFSLGHPVHSVLLP